MQDLYPRTFNGGVFTHDIVAGRISDLLLLLKRLVIAPSFTCHHISSEICKWLKNIHAEHYVCFTPEDTILFVVLS